MVIVGVVHKPNFIDSVIVKVERIKRTKPSSRHNSFAKLTPPEDLSIFGKEHKLQRVGREKEHFFKWIDRRICAIDGKKAARTILPEFHRYHPALPDW